MALCVVFGVEIWCCVGGKVRRGRSCGCGCGCDGLVVVEGEVQGLACKDGWGLVRDGKSGEGAGGGRRQIEYPPSRKGPGES